MVALVRPGGRVVVADVGFSPTPEAGESTLLRALWRMALSLTKAAGQRRPWLLLSDQSDVVERFASGYVGIAGATVSPGDRERAG